MLLAGNIRSFFYQIDTTTLNPSRAYRIGVSVGFSQPITRVIDVYAEFTTVDAMNAPILKKAQFNSDGNIIVSFDVDVGILNNATFPRKSFIDFTTGITYCDVVFDTRPSGYLNLVRQGIQNDCQLQRINGTSYLLIFSSDFQM